MLFVKVNKLIERIPSRAENDIYIVIKYNDDVRRTTAKINDNNPEWNETFLFDITENNLITVEVWDYDVWGADNIINSYSRYIKDICEKSNHEFGPVSLTIENNNHKYNALVKKHNKLENTYIEQTKNHEYLYYNYLDVLAKVQLLETNYDKLDNNYNNLQNVTSSIKELIDTCT
jgi:hypothetical protein